MLLIIDTKAQRGESFVHSFYWMGVVSVCHKPIRALSEISPAVGAVLIVEPRELPDMADYVARVRALCRTVPIFALTDEEVRGHLFIDVFSTRGFTATYLSRMRDAANRIGVRPVGVYRLSGMDVSCTQETLTYKGQSVRLTKTEAMILRYLFLSYPARVDAHQILTHAYRKDTRPDVGAIRAHICSLNRKLSPVIGYRAIHSERGEGYRVADAPRSPWGM